LKAIQKEYYPLQSIKIVSMDAPLLETMFFALAIAPSTRSRIRKLQKILMLEKI
jgi:hypothetical protein